MDINQDFQEKIYQTACMEDGFGNRILYDMCKKTIPEDQAIAALGDKIWLIGRSYSASPERRYTWNKASKLTTDQKKLDTVGDGTETYFHWIAKQLSFPLENFQNAEYRFDFSDDDLSVLESSIIAVLGFNKSIRDANKKYDHHHNRNHFEHMVHRNQLSFSSKFLHFHYPDSIFIIDDFSACGGRYLFSKKNRIDAGFSQIPLDAGHISEAACAIIDSSLSGRGEFQSKINRFKTSDKIATDVVTSDQQLINQYTNHCLNAYLAGCLIRICARQFPIFCTMPRAVDNLLLYIKKLDLS